MAGGEGLNKGDNTVTPISCSIPGKVSYEVRGFTFTIDKRYKITKPIGVGAYGIVMAAYDSTTETMVALKKVRSVFEDLVDAKRVLREIRLMQALNHDNILPLLDMEAPDSMDFDDIYLISPLYDKDLSKILAAKVSLTTAHKQYFVYQLLCAVKYLHSASVLHRDIKPANILVQESCDLALCDFGLARYVCEQDAEEKGMTEYVVTRWYRAPELVLTHEYTSAVDVWAVGCILGELLGGSVLFRGRDFKHQVETICGVLGKPGAEDTQHVTSGSARRFLEGLPDAEGKRFAEMFPEAEAEAVDLLERLLKFNPDKRLTAEEALQHPWVSGFHDDEFEGVAGGVVDMRGMEPDEGELTADGLRRLMMKEVFKFRPQARIFEEFPELAP